MQSPPTPLDEPRAALPYLPYLEGLRGLGALYVVLSHTRELLDGPDHVTGPNGAYLWGQGLVLDFGNAGVALFIVLSGFVLTLPLAVRGTLGSGGLLGFAKRRARRMLPTFYAAIAFSIPLWILLLHARHEPVGFGALWHQIATHVLLIYDFFDGDIDTINGAMWSVAVECQIYVVFALLMIPMQRRFGLLATIVAMFAIGLVPTLRGALRHDAYYRFEDAHFWYLGLFAMGSAAATIGYGPAAYARMRDRLPWKTFCAAGFIATVAIMAPIWGVREPPIAPPADVTTGITLAAGLLAVARDRARGRRSIAATFLGWKPFVWLGTFSYSLYLVHKPILDLALAIAPPVGLARVQIAFGLVPVCVAVAYGFARLFEFPFLSAFRRNGETAALAAPSPSASYEAPRSRVRPDPDGSIPSFVLPQATQPESVAP